MLYRLIDNWVEVWLFGSHPSRGIKSGLSTQIDSFMSAMCRLTNHSKLVVHKLRSAGQIRPATSRQVAPKVQQESLKYAKYGTPFIA